MHDLYFNDPNINKAVTAVATMTSKSIRKREL